MAAASCPGDRAARAQQGRQRVLPRLSCPAMNASGRVLKSDLNRDTAASSAVFIVPYIVQRECAPLTGGLAIGARVSDCAPPHQRPVI